MATLNTDDIKTVDELDEISKEELSNEDSLLTFDKDMNAHKKFKVSALRAWMLEDEKNAREAAARAAESGANASSSAESAESAAVRAESALENLSGQAVLAESWAVGGTGTREGEDTNNAWYYAERSGASADNASESEGKAKASEEAAAESEAKAKASEENVTALEADARASRVAAAESETNAKESEESASVSETNAKASEEAASASEAHASESEGKAAESAALAESWTRGGTGTREGEDTNNAQYYAERAGSSASEAASSASHASESERNASESETKTAISEANAAGSASAAASSEANAREYMESASASEQRALEAEGNAADSAALARSWAVGDTGTREGEETDNSKHYAEQASGSATSAATSEENAAKSESNADRMLKRILEFAGQGFNLPAGIVFPYAGKFLPSGFLWCDGSAVSRTEYADLYHVVGTDYGAGNGSTTFNVPDYRECTLVGAGQNTTNTIAAHDTYCLGEFKDDQVQSHNHSIAHTHNINHTHSYDQPSAGNPIGFGVTGGLNWQTRQTSGPSNINSGEASNGHSGLPGCRNGTVTRGKRKGVNFIIKT